MPDAPPSPTPQPRRWPWLLLLAAMGVGGIWAWQQSQHMAALQQQLLALQAQQQRTDRAYDRTSLNLASDVRALQAALKDERSRLNAVDATLGSTAAHLHREAARTLIQAAQEQEALLHHSDAALALLDAADRHLQAMPEADAAPLRAALAADRSALQARVRPDYLGAAYTLAAWAETAAQWPLRTEAPQRLAPAPPTVAPAATEGWLASARTRLGAALTDVIRIRRDDRPIPALVQDEARALVPQLLLVRIEALRLAALRRDASAFAAHVGPLQTCLVDYYRAEHPAVQAAAAQLAQWSAWPVQPPAAPSQSLGQLGRSAP